MSVTYFKRNYGISVNEGGRFANFTVLWGSRGMRLFFYVYMFGFRWSFAIKNRDCNA